MIAISHSQARRLIQYQLDERELLEAQWAELQAHLETCAECRAFRDQLALTERSLRRALRTRWDPVVGPAEGISAELAVLFRERKKIRRMGFWMVSGAAAFLLGVVWFVAWAATMLSGASEAPALANLRVNATSTPLPTPTRPAARYNGVVAYEVRSGESGTNAEIYLLNPGAEPVNLTSHPANDRAPAWSPDGQWLAFLSDRTGKDEVYVMHISGTRLTQLTDQPDVAWRGPLSWSADGQMLALIGMRLEGKTGDNWVYIIPLDGSNAYPLGSSAGAISAAFSPARGSKQLAFSSRDHSNGWLAIYDFDPGQERFLFVDRSYSSSTPVSGETSVSPETEVSPERLRSVDLLEWSTDGKRLLFRTNSAFDSRGGGGNIRQVGLRVVDIGGLPAPSNLSSQVLIDRIFDVDLWAISWTGIQNEIAYLGRKPDTETLCETLRLITSKQPRVDPVEVDVLCVDGGLEGANWRISQKSVLVVGYEPGREKERGLYVVRFQGKTPRAVWLADARDMAGPPRLRPLASLLAIDPRPVRAAAVLPPSPLPGAEVANLLVVSVLNQRKLINRLDPGGSDRATINQSIGENWCPTWSPDHAQIAFFSNRASADKSFSDLFVMDSSGLNASQITISPDRYPTTKNLANTRYGCPLWSPDGRWLAVTGSLPGKRLALIPLDQKDGKPLYLSHDPQMEFNQMAWLPDGRLMTAYSGANRIFLYAYDPGSPSPSANVQSADLPGSADWTYTTAMAVSPDGKIAALAVVRIDPNDGDTAGLVTLSLEKANLTRPGELVWGYRHELNGLLVGNTLHWLPDGRLGYILRYPEGRPVKAEVFAIAPQGSPAPERLASFTDTLRAAAWTADGRWLTAITGGGRYVLDLSLAPGAAPTRVDGDTSTDVDW